MRQLLTLSVLGLLLVGLTSCSKDKSEAARFCRFLKSQEQQAIQIDNQEGQTLQSVATWTGQLAFLGVGQARPEEAFALYRSVTPLQNAVNNLRRSLEAQKIDAPFVQTTRNSLVGQFKAREDFWTEVCQSLGRTGGEMQNTAFAHVPPSLNSLVNRVRAYTPQQGQLQAAMTQLRSKFELSDSDIAQ
jgi:hypothetical protein